MTGIIVKNYEHFNRALGKQITSRAHYEAEMKKGGFVSFEEGEKLSAEYRRRNPRKEYELEKDSHELINSFKSSVDKKGKLNLSGRQLDAMKAKGVIKKVPAYMQLPASYQVKGGFGK